MPRSWLIVTLIFAHPTQWCFKGGGAVATPSDAQIWLRWPGLMASRGRWRLCSDAGYRYCPTLHLHRSKTLVKRTRQQWHSHDADMGTALHRRDIGSGRATYKITKFWSSSFRVHFQIHHCAAFPSISLPCSYQA
ncbi:hypothetical protein PENSPDRAFT_42356 [Peniophora sp. CONT]|nr:hypothetical protein PENSPDRAFT_42356 [Peniophora sp. CONT]